MDNLDLDAVVYAYKRLIKADEPLTAEDIAYISGRLEEFLRTHGYVHDSEPIPVRKKSFWDKFK